MALLLVAQICPRMGAGWPACFAVHGLGHWVGTHGTLGHQCTMVLPVGGPIAALRSAGGSVLNSQFTGAGAAD